MEREEVIEQVAGWIDPYAIAELVVDTLEEEDQPATVEAAKEAWLSILERLASDMVVLTTSP